MEEITKIKDSIVQISNLNDRVYLMELGNDFVDEVIEKIDKICKEKKLSKVFAKIPEKFKEKFEKNGYFSEGIVKNYFLNGNAYFMSKFFDESRKKSNNEKEFKDILNYIQNISKSAEVKIDKKYTVKIATETDSLNLSKHYSKVFETYPFPIDDPEYIKKTMKSHVKYLVIEDSGKIVAASSCEMDLKNKCVEMTDFAVLPEYRKQGFSEYLLYLMEKIMKDNGFRIFYTISRSLSYGMNITFKKMGYIYGGTAINNTNICGKFEDMNFWYKIVE